MYAVNRSCSRFNSQKQFLQLGFPLAATPIFITFPPGAARYNEHKCPVVPVKRRKVLQTCEHGGGSERTVSVCSCFDAYWSSATRLQLLEGITAGTCTCSCTPYSTEQRRTSRSLATVSEGAARGSELALRRACERAV